MKNIIIKIDGMNCNHCKMSVERILSRIKGVTSYSVDLEKGQAEISGNPDIEIIISEINSLGYQASIKG